MLDRYFGISTHKSTLSREIRGGLATFIAMSYIVVLNPLILSGKDGAGTVLGIPRVAAVTALVAGLLTILMGVWAKHPFAIATGLGVNALVAVTVATHPTLTWPDVMGLVVIAGLVMLVLVLTGFRTAVFRAVPENLKTAIVVGIGMFIALIGLVNAGFVRRIPDSAHTTVPVELGIGGKLLGWPTLVFVFGLVLTIVLLVRKVNGAILIGIIASSVLANILQAALHLESSVKDPRGWSLVVPGWSSYTEPDLSLIGEVSPFGAFAHMGAIAATLLAFVVLLSIFFDAMGTTVGLAREAGSIDANGDIPRLDRVLAVDAIGAAAGGASSVSSNQIFIESGTGIGEGARTGLASVVTGTLFIASMFLTPLISLVPFEAVAPALVVVGIMMVGQIRNLKLGEAGDLADLIPVFFTIALMPFTYSIANGLGAGFIAYVLVRLTQGRVRDIHPLMWVVAFAFVIYFAIGPINNLLGVG